MKNPKKYFTGVRENVLGRIRETEALILTGGDREGTLVGNIADECIALAIVAYLVLV